MVTMNKRERARLESLVRRRQMKPSRRKYVTLEMMHVAKQQEPSSKMQMQTNMFKRYRSPSLASSAAVSLAATSSGGESVGGESQGEELNTQGDNWDAAMTLSNLALTTTTLSVTFNPNNSARKNGARQCEFLGGCTKKVAQGSTTGRRFCVAHGGGRRCTFQGCDKAARDKYFCAAHGGGKRCCVEGCNKSAVGGSAQCTRHGGGKRCKAQGCDKSAMSGTNFCVRHGGGKKCSHVDAATQKRCEKAARGRTDHCASHGGGVRCKWDNCNSLGIGKLQLCRKHGQQNAALLQAQSSLLCQPLPPITENTNEDEVPKGGGVENDIRDDLMRSSESENNSMEGALEDELTLEEMSDGESVVVDPPVQKEVARETAQCQPPAPRSFPNDEAITMGKSKKTEVVGLFPNVLYTMIEKEDDSIIEWMDEGAAFRVTSPRGLELILKKYFRHKNFSSFQRQLNMYGFSKISGGELSSGFRREGFFRGQKEFDHILRKVTQKSVNRKVTKNKGVGSRKALAKEDGEKEGDSGEKMGRKERKLSA